MQVEGLRCLRAVSLNCALQSNVIVGANGAGKTSLIEAIFFLGRGRSFRSGGLREILNSGVATATLFAEVDTADGQHRLGVELSRSGSSIRIDGESGATAADLSRANPVQIIDAQAHELIQGGPDGRRRFVDWGVFHVKHEFIDAWRRYRRTLQQRNMALRSGDSRNSVSAWDSDLLDSGNSVNSLRESYVSGLAAAVSRKTVDLLGAAAKLSYRPGWAQEKTFATALAESWERDRSMGSTQVGPHRADLIVEIDGTPARHRLSRGQQKLMAAALILAQTEMTIAERNLSVALLVDEPAAELDTDSLARLLAVLPGDRKQLFITTLHRDAINLSGDVETFHVERGKVATLV